MPIMVKNKKFNIMEIVDLVIGADYGTDSVRSILVNAVNGDEIAESVYYYPRWKAGKYCEPSKSRFRQHPLDYLEGLETTIKDVLKKAPAGSTEKVRAIAVDTTGSTPVAVTQNGTPLALTKGFEENPNAMFILWKDHTAVKEAAEINALAKTWSGVDYTKFEGGVYSSEWFWAKILHVVREDPKVAEAAFSWVEHCDWIPAVLTGMTDPLKIKRSRCAAGHKAMWHPDFGGLPSEEFLTKLDPLLKGVRDKLYVDTYTSDVPAGNLSKDWAEKLGLSTNVRVGVGAFDAHFGAVGSEIEPYTLSKVMGTSTCDMLIAPAKDIEGKVVKGICGQVDGSIVPGMIGLEAGQSAFGDIYAWFKNMLMWPARNILDYTQTIDQETREKLVEELEKKIIPKIEEAAAKIPIEQSGVLALDWMNGRRTPDANQALKGAIINLDLGSDAPRVYRALAEATVFGSKKIVDRFISEGVQINQVAALGGVAKKSPFVMQLMADVLDMPVKVATSLQTVALGSAMFAAVVAGIYKTVEDAQKAMGKGFEKEYLPIPENVEKYKILYAKYERLGELIEKETV
jgi:L-ribulokinase